MANMVITITNSYNPDLNREYEACSDITIEMKGEKRDIPFLVFTSYSDSPSTFTHIPIQDGAEVVISIRHD